MFSLPPHIAEATQSWCLAESILLDICSWSPWDHPCGLENGDLWSVVCVGEVDDTVVCKQLMVLSFLQRKNSVHVWWCRTSSDQLGAHSTMWFALQTAVHQCHGIFLRKGDSVGCVFKPQASCRGSREWLKTSNKTPWADAWDSTSLQGI